MTEVSKTLSIKMNVEINPLTWEDFMILVGGNLSSECIHVNETSNPGSPYLSFYKDGTIYAGTNRGSVRLFTKATPNDMFYLYRSKLSEIDRKTPTSIRRMNDER